MPQAEKSSAEESARHLRSRTEVLQNVGDVLSKGQLDVQLVQYLKTKKNREEQEIVIEALGKDIILELPLKSSLWP